MSIRETKHTSTPIEVTMNITRNHFAVVFILGTTLFGCAKKIEAKVATNPPADPPPALMMAPSEPAETSTVAVAPDIVKACNITEPEAHFMFNSSNVRNTDATTLDKLADCFAHGALKGKTVKVIGHTDPRGSNEYNMTLGQSRADAIARYLVTKGVERNHSVASTRGELDAIGADEKTWERDRRVDLLLAE
jgi:peptidoglycan-associated lipoprotein